MTFSKQQLDIFEWVKSGNGNLIIKARAGSGKTFVAVQAVQYMKGSVLAMAFNNKAAKELATRLSNMACPNALASTVHSAGKNLIYKSQGYHKVDASKVFWITEKYCKGDLAFTRNFIAKLVGFAKQSAFGVEGQISIDDTQAWMDIINHHDIEMNFDSDLGTVIDIAKDVLKDSNRDTKVIDFDDMQYLPLIYKCGSVQYDWVIIDEAQDTNVCRKLLLKMLLKPSGRLIAIGDEGQAIYAFCGAETNSINLIKDMFNCSELPLSTCYRCDKVIIEAAQKYFPDIQSHDDAGEGSISSMTYNDFISNVQTLKLDGSVGILCRNNAPNVSLAFSLIKEGIGCFIEGRDIGNDLKKLVKKWKRVTTLDEFTLRLVEFFNKEFDKASYTKLQLLEDKMNTMIILIERCKDLGKNDLNSLEKLITDMFKDSDDNTRDIVTLSSIHKAKGLEWDTCYMVDMNQFIPSRYAKQDWELEAENCLAYVGITRARHDLIHITDFPSRSKE